MLSAALLVIFCNQAIKAYENAYEFYLNYLCVRMEVGLHQTFLIIRVKNEECFLHTFYQQEEWQMDNATLKIVSFLTIFTQCKIDKLNIVFYGRKYFKENSITSQSTFQKIECTISLFFVVQHLSHTHTHIPPPLFTFMTFLFLHYFFQFFPTFFFNITT